jgi:Zn-dependent protease
MTKSYGNDGQIVSALASLSSALFAIKAAAELSIAIALTNWLPYFKLDGYWILSELARGLLRLRLRWQAMRAADIAYSVLTGVLGAGIVMTIVLAGT